MKQSSNLKIMWLIVLFDLPVKTKKQRRAAAQFRKSLLADGFLMLQYSVYVRACGGEERIDKHIRRVKNILPHRGSIRALKVTDRQYNAMDCLLGAKKKEEKHANSEQLLLF